MEIRLTSAVLFAKLTHRNPCRCAQVKIILTVLSQLVFIFSAFLIFNTYSVNAGEPLPPSNDIVPFSKCDDISRIVVRIITNAKHDQDLRKAIELNITKSMLGMHYKTIKNYPRATLPKIDFVDGVDRFEPSDDTLVVEVTADEYQLLDHNTSKLIFVSIGARIIPKSKGGDSLKWPYTFIVRDQTAFSNPDLLDHGNHSSMFQYFSKNIAECVYWKYLYDEAIKGMLDNKQMRK